MLNRLPYKIATNRSGVFEVRWTERSGARSITRTWSTGATERDEADAAAEEFWRERHRIDTQNGTPRVREIGEAYLAAGESARNLSQGQRWSLQSVFKHFGDYPPAALTPDEITKYRVARLKAGIKTGTIRRQLGALTAALNWGVKARMVKREDLPFIELPADSPARAVWLGKADEQDFWDRALKTTPDGAQLTPIARYVTLSLATAARQSAVLELTWAGVDFDAGLIDFRRRDGRATKKRRAVVPISDRLRPVLERARLESVERGEPSSARVCGRVTIRKEWDAFVASTPYAINPHDMRRTWASLAAQRGVPIYDIAKMLCDTVATVEKHYGHLAPHHLRGAVNP